MNTLNVCSRRRTGASDFLAPRREHEGEGEYFIERASPAYLNRVLAPESEVLSCRDKKVPKETPSPSRRPLSRVPCASRRSRARQTAYPYAGWLVRASLRALLEDKELFRLQLRCSASTRGGLAKSSQGLPFRRKRIQLAGSAVIPSHCSSI